MASSRKENSDLASAKKLALLVAFISLSILLAVLKGVGLTNSLDYVIYGYLGLNYCQLIVLLTYTASAYSFTIYVLLILIYDIVRFREISLITSSFILSLVLTELTVLGLKVVFQSPRPGESVIHVSILKALFNYDVYSFPSGHSSRAAVLSFYLSKNRNIIVKSLAWLWFIGISLSRLLLGVHWFSDVTESLLLGISISLLVDYTSPKWVSYYNRLVRNAKPLAIG